MPTTSDPMPPPNPYAGGCNNPVSDKEVSNKETKAIPISNIAIPTAVAFGALAISLLSKEKTPTNNAPTVSHTPDPSNKTTKTIWHTLLLIISTPIITLLFWYIACFTIDNNIQAGYNTLAPKPHLLIILLVPTLLILSAILPILSPWNKISQPIIELKFPGKEITENKNELRDFISGHLKIFNYAIPVSVAISFIFVLYHYKEVTSGDLGLALQITSAQFPDQKITWTTVIFVYLSIFYISFLPAIILPQINKPSMNHELHQHVFKDTSPLVAYYIYLVTQAAILTTASSFITLSILKIATNGGTAETLLFTFSLSMTACTIPISRIIKKNTKNDEESNKEINHNVCISRIFTGFLAALVLYISYLSPTLFLEYMPKNIGGIVANPGTTIETNEIDYACIFPSGEDNPKSIAFGIITSSDNSSIHLFTPSYNTKNKKYAELQKDGRRKPYKLIESRIKYTNGFYIEKYDGKIHTYNENSGQCVYQKSPFDIFTRSWNTPDKN